LKLVQHSSRERYFTQTATAAIEQTKHDFRLDDITTNKDLDARIKETELKIELVRAEQKLKSVKGELVENKKPNVKNMTYHEWLNVVDKMNAGDLMLFKRLV